MLCGGSIGLQADTVTLASGMPLEFPAPPSLQILAIARYRCGLRLVWHENPSLLYVPSRMKHYTSRRGLPITPEFLLSRKIHRFGSAFRSHRPLFGLGHRFLSEDSS